MAGQVKSGERILGDLAALKLYVVGYGGSVKNVGLRAVVNLVTLGQQLCTLAEWLPCSQRADGTSSRLRC